MSPEFGDPRLPERFWSKVHVTESGCWEWTAALSKAGYGWYNEHNRPDSAHRVAWRTLIGPLPRATYLDHQCRNRACVNLAHLRPGPSSENQQNRGPSEGSKSGYRNVTWNGRKKCWNVVLKHHGKRYWGGSFSNPEEANRVAVSLRNNLYVNNILDRVAS